MGVDDWESYCDQADDDDELCLAFSEEASRRTSSDFQMELLRRQADGAGCSLEYLSRGPSPLQPPHTVVSSVFSALSQNDYPEADNGVYMAFLHTEPMTEAPAVAPGQGPDRWSTRAGTRGEIVHYVTSGSPRAPWTWPLPGSEAVADMAGLEMHGFSAMLRRSFPELLTTATVHVGGPPIFGEGDSSCVLGVHREADRPHSTDNEGADGLTTRARGTVTQSYEVTMRRQDVGPHRDCWMIRSVKRCSS